jgi:hypothetical protein
MSCAGIIPHIKSYGFGTGHAFVFKYMNEILYVQSNTTYDVIIFIY